MVTSQPPAVDCHSSCCSGLRSEFVSDLTMTRVGLSPLPQPQSTMLSTLWLLLSFAVPVRGIYKFISCPHGKQCQKALLSSNDVLLQCSSAGAHWYYFFLQTRSGWTTTNTSVSNMVTTPVGHLLIRDPLPSQTGLYSCWNENGTQETQYEIDFQDVSSLHITHKSLDQDPLHNESLELGRQETVFTHWEPWQDCNRCDVPGERKRLGYCYIQEPQEEPVPCGIFLGQAKLKSNRLRPEMQVEACLVPCDPQHSYHHEYTVFDSFSFSKESEALWLTCSLGSIYRPIMWEVNGIPLTWRGQLIGQGMNTVLDTSTGGRQLQIFQPATYKCYVHQEFMAQFSPVVGPEALEEQNKKEEQQWQVGKVLVPPKEADSVLKGLKLMLLMVFVLALAGLLFRVFHPAWDKRKNSVLLVK
ncbi:protein FAM187B-like isoform X2 [Marmota marmota marmota]|uniref:protein FAM187B-like isoform X2 n=1 Tax=Marmota marmota marmota TaxID=9994 RepID=UPI000762668C|nr:protein FAM187B-like isoform X2 [Marmota marmota marmota]